MTRLSRLSDFDKLLLAAFAALVALSVLVGTGAVTLARMEASLPLCLFRAVTGVPCPGCGMAHALIHALNFDVVASFNAHPLGLPLLAAWVWRLARALRVAPPQPRLSPAPAAAILGVIAFVYASRFV